MEKERHESENEKKSMGRRMSTWECSSSHSHFHDAPSPSFFSYLPLGFFFIAFRSPHYNGKMGDGMKKKGRTAAIKISEEKEPKGSSKMQNEVFFFHTISHFPVVFHSSLLLKSTT
jgi:hypothetical protein